MNKRQIDSNENTELLNTNESRENTESVNSPSNDSE